MTDFMDLDLDFAPTNLLPDNVWMEWLNLPEDDEKKTPQPLHDFAMPKKRKAPATAAGTGPFHFTMEKNMQESEIWRSDAQRLKIENEELTQRVTMLAAQLETVPDHETAFQGLLQENQQLRQANLMLTAQLQTVPDFAPGPADSGSPPSPVYISSDSEDDDLASPHGTRVLCIKRLSLPAKRTVQNLGYRVVDSITGRGPAATLVTDPHQKTPELLYAITHNLRVVDELWLSDTSRSMDDFVVDINAMYTIDPSLYDGAALKVQGYNGATFKDEWQRTVVATLSRLGLTIAHSNSEADKIIQPFYERRVQKGLKIATFLDDVMKSRN